MLSLRAVMFNLTWAVVLLTLHCYATTTTLALARSTRYIVPGATWRDTDGEILSAQAGGVVQTNGAWYWFGQNERANITDTFSGKPLLHSLSSYLDSICMMYARNKRLLLR